MSDEDPEREDLVKNLNETWDEVVAAVDRFSVFLEQTPVSISPWHFDFEHRIDYTLVNRRYFETLKDKAYELDELFRDPEREERESAELIAMINPTEH